jgi:alkylation response protein AidB-like acyl-CoA dehydrogenase
MPASLHRTATPCEPGRSDSAEEARAWQFRAAEFAQELVHPLGLALDRLGAEQVVQPTSPLYEFMAQAHEERFTRLSESSALGGAGISREAEYYVLEELAAADAGLGALLIVAPLPFRWALMATGHTWAQELARDFFSGQGPGLSGCVHSAAKPAQIHARRADGGWRLHGATRTPIIGAASATHAIITCTAAACAEEHALAIVPLEREGVRRTLPAGRLGLRAGAAATLSFSDVRLEREELRFDGDTTGGLTAGLLAVDHLAAAMASVGIARSAYEGAVRWCSERRANPGQHVGAMRAMLERARALTRAAHRHTYGQLDAGRPASPQNAAFARMLASQTAAELATQALASAGPQALDPDGVEYLDGSRFRPEKLVRDAHEYGLIRHHRAGGTRQQQVHPRERRSAAWGS